VCVCVPQWSLKFSRNARIDVARELEIYGSSSMIIIICCHHNHATKLFLLLCKWAPLFQGRACAISYKAIILWKERAGEREWENEINCFYCRKLTRSQRRREATERVFACTCVAAITVWFHRQRPIKATLENISFFFLRRFNVYIRVALSMILLNWNCFSTSLRFINSRSRGVDRTPQRHLLSTLHQ
jgi:hypothetical protein